MEDGGALPNRITSHLFASLRRFAPPPPPLEEHCGVTEVQDGHGPEKLVDGIFEVGDLKPFSLLHAPL